MITINSNLEMIDSLVATYARQIMEAHLDGSAAKVFIKEDSSSHADDWLLAIAKSIYEEAPKGSGHPLDGVMVVAVLKREADDEAGGIAVQLKRYLDAHQEEVPYNPIHLTFEFAKIEDSVSTDLDEDEEEEEDEDEEEGAGCNTISLKTRVNIPLDDESTVEEALEHVREKTAESLKLDPSDVWVDSATLVGIEPEICFLVEVMLGISGTVNMQAFLGLTESSVIEGDKKVSTSFRPN